MRTQQEKKEFKFRFSFKTQAHLNGKPKTDKQIDAAVDKFAYKAAVNELPVNQQKLVSRVAVEWDGKTTQDGNWIYVKGMIDATIYFKQSRPAPKSSKTLTVTLGTGKSAEVLHFPLKPVSGPITHRDIECITNFITIKSPNHRNVLVTGDMPEWTSCCVAFLYDFKSCQWLSIEEPIDEEDESNYDETFFYVMDEIVAMGSRATFELK